MAKLVRIKVGDVFAIPLAESAFALSLCTFVSRRFKNMIACRVFDTTIDSPKSVDPMPATIAFDPLFMGKQIITAGTWPIVGHISIEVVPILYRVADGKYDGDEYVGPAGDEGLPNLLAYGPIAVQQLLHQHFRLAQ